MANFSWSFSSQYERSKRWYAVAATIIITGTIVSFLVGEYLLGIVLILFAGVYILYDINTHPVVNVSIDTQGISLNGELYTYDRINSFQVIRVDNIPMMFRFKLKSKTIGRLDIFADTSVNLEEVALFLVTYIAQEETENMSAIARLLLGLRL